MNREMLEKIAKAQIITRAERFADGKYVLIVKKVLLEKMFKGTMFIVEFYVKESNPTKADVKPNIPGSSVGFAINLDTNLSGPGNAKAFVLGLLGANEASAEDLANTVEKLTEASQPARGMLIGCETYRTITKKGIDFLGQNWLTVQQKPEEIKKRRTDLEASKAA